MPSPNSLVNSHRSPVTAFNSFSFTLLSKNASTNHLESHSCKNKGLKVPCFHTLTKKGVGEGVPWGFSVRLPTSDLQPPLSQSPVTNHQSRITASESFCRPRTYIGNV